MFPFQYLDGSGILFAQNYFLKMFWTDRKVLTLLTFVLKAWLYTELLLIRLFELSYAKHTTYKLERAWNEISRPWKCLEEQRKTTKLSHATWSPGRDPNTKQGVTLPRSLIYAEYPSVWKRVVTELSKILLWFGGFLCQNQYTFRTIVVTPLNWR